MICLRCGREVSAPNCGACGYSHKQRIAMLRSLPKDAYVFKSTEEQAAAPEQPVPKRTTERSLRSYWPLAAFLVLALIVGLSIYSWSLGQWLVGILLCVLLVGITIFACAEYVVTLPQICIVGGLSIINVVLACLYPQQLSTLAFWIALGGSIALFVCALFSYEFVEEDVGAAAVVLMAGDLAVATTVLGGLQGFWLWLLAYLLPLLVIAFLLAGLFEKLCVDDGILIASCVAGAVLLVHILLVCFAPHFLHAFHKLPQLQDQDPGPKQAVCYCEETIQVSHFLGEMIHGYSCEHYDLLDPMAGTTYRSDENYHWLLCECGTALGATSTGEAHRYEEGVCKACGYKYEEP